MSIRDDAGRWNLVAAEMENMCGLQSWKTNSRVVRGIAAAGAGAGGPFEIVGVIATPFAHNPKIMRAPDGTYLLFSIGSGLWSTTPENCSAAGSLEDASGASIGSLENSAADYPGPTHDGCGGGGNLNGGCGISIGSAPSLDGPWSFAPLLISNQNASTLLDCAHTNPSAAFHANGSVLLAFNAGWCHSNAETLGILTAPSWRGPWSYLTPDPILLNADGSFHHCEDPFLWITARGYHLMAHNQQGSGVGLYAHSLDARSWTLHDAAGYPGPYTGVIRWQDGSVDDVDVERPQFVFNPESGAPLYLTNGAEGSPSSYTLFRPLAQTPPPPPPPPARLVNAFNACLAPTAPPPCWTSPQGFWVCSLNVSASACSDDGGLWEIADSTIVSAAGGAGAGAPLNLDCDACAAGTLLKLISSGTSAFTFDAAAGEIRAASCTAPPMCVTNGVASGASAPCGGGSEPWSPTTPHLAPCGGADTAGWTLQPTLSLARGS